MRPILALLPVLCAACATTSGSSVTNAGGAQYDVTSVLNDFNSKKISDQSFVSVSGYLTFGDDKHNLWSSAGEYQYIREKMPPLSDPAWKKCIALDYYGKFRRGLLKYDGKEVIISGYISRNIPEADEFNLGSCSEVFISMEGVGARVMRVREKFGITVTRP